MKIWFVLLCSSQRHVQVGDHSLPCSAFPLWSPPCRPQSHAACWSRPSSSPSLHDSPRSRQHSWALSCTSSVRADFWTASSCSYRRPPGELMKCNIHKTAWPGRKRHLSFVKGIFLKLIDWLWMSLLSIQTWIVTFSHTLLLCVLGWTEWTLVQDARDSRVFSWTLWHEVKYSKIQKYHQSKLSFIWVVRTFLFVPITL